MNENFVETEGNTVEDAINIALEQLNAKRDQVSVKVLCEEEKGLFGMKGAKPARVRVSLKKA